MHRRRARRADRGRARARRHRSPLATPSALADGEVLLPGLVDTHVHINEPGRTEWEGFDTGTRAAAAGGVTTVIDMPLNSIPATTTVAALERKRECAAAQVHVDVGFWGGAVPGNVGELEGLHEAGVLGFKCFLVDSGVPEFPPLEPAGLAAAMTETARLGALLIAHAEDAELIAAAPAPGGPSYATYLRSRPAAAEERAIERLLAGRPRHPWTRARGAPFGGRSVARAARRARRRCRRISRDLSALPRRSTPRRSTMARRSSSALRRSAIRPTASGCGTR